MLSRRQALAALASAPAFAQQQRRRPNILFVMTDDHSVAHLSCYGNKIVRTPNMDRIATEGVRFRNAFCTNSLCAPARASCLTGTYSHINGVLGNSEAKDTKPETLKSGIATWPGELRRAGYKTAVVGKWHLTDAPADFDYSCVLPGQGLYFDPDFIENGHRKKMRGYATDITTDLALKWLESAGDGPWALVYQHKAPHRPFTPAARHARLFDEADFPVPATFNDDYATRRMASEAQDMRFDISVAPDYKELPKNLTPEQKKRWVYQRFVKDHARATVGVDENLGRVLEYLDRNKLADDTLVIYTTDNGFFLGEHGWYDKRFMYEPALRIPLMIRYPRAVKAGGLADRFALNIDFAPTILDYAGVRIPESVQGRSLRPLLEGQPPRDWRSSMLYTYYENSWHLTGKGREALSDPSFEYFTPHRVPPHRGVRADRYKLIEYYSEGDYHELFDLQKDPDELRNVYSDASYRSVASDLKKELRRLQEQYRAT